MNSPTKPYSLVLEERPHYLYARVTADTIDRDGALSYLTAVARRLAELPYKLLMLERCIPQMLNPEDLRDTTRDFFEMIGDTKAAFINPYLSIEAAMAVAISIGTDYGANYRLFNCPIIAEEWLLDPHQNSIVTI